MSGQTHKRFAATLESERLHFRHFSAHDAQDLFEYAGDEETVRYLTWPRHKSVQESEEIIHKLLSNDQTYAIVLKQTDKVVGCIDLRLLTETQASFGYVLNRAYWNQGFMSEALHCMLDYLFEELGMGEVESCHEKENQASGRVMTKCGMRWTHLALGETMFGKVSDNQHYSITREQWSEGKKSSSC
ncbi:GNAT family N-acetyltransferase [Sphaerochaeta sp. PS]|uniref:GNAT family N-acetyltransferase n=1 Tax=Sphaerochaeta sp. PS TaxID=3076336 RepID=UPI0028A53D9D|nr:GNAT family N-acetyltransferase [Sphaerochaeta sp. PS]MDT4761619.1 GNAT family N-acetyltransferase [Sphaerochaeta sp. PS]